MSYADKLFKETCREILENGTNTKGQKVRPKWKDGERAYTLKTFGVVNKYDLRKEFPALTLRKTALKSAMDEILWIYQKKSNNVNDLNSHIWDSWADKNGSIGSAYGYQVAQTYVHHNEPVSGSLINELKNYPSGKINGIGDVWLDQIDAVLFELKNNPFSRRIMISLWNFEDLQDMNLQPCCWSCTFNVTDEGGDKLVLNMVLNQRSNDMLAANNWNVSQYAILLMMIAQVSNMVPGQLIHMIADAHIYDRHIDIVKELLEREEYDAPKVSLNPNVKNFYDFKVDDLIIEDYKYGEQVKFEVAI